MEIVALWSYHVALTSLGFILLATGMFIARYLKTRKEWLKIHKALGVFGTLFVLAGLFMAIYMIAISPGQHFAVPHTYLGAIAIIFVGLTPILGYAQFHVTSNRATIRAIHRWSGRSTLVLVLSTMLSGLSLVGLL
jgi:protein-S-isoprenylcysteine O-methyltransferase Ste14